MDKYYIKKGNTVNTPHGKAEILLVDHVNKCIRVKHLEAKTAITDYRFSDLSSPLNSDEELNNILP